MFDQYFVFATLVLVLILFVWGRWRYDLVAIIALLLLTITLVMGPGGYHFGDYWRMGLPLTVLIVLVAGPLIMLVWPL